MRGKKIDRQEGQARLTGPGPACGISCHLGRLSLAGCSPAEPASVLPVRGIMARAMKTVKALGQSLLHQEQRRAN